MNRTSQAGSARTVEVAEATEQRKEEHGEYIQFMEENNAAVQLLEKAKNKLNKSRSSMPGLCSVLKWLLLVT